MNKCARSGENNIKTARKTTIRLTQMGVSGHDLCSRSEEHTSELQSQSNLVCRLLLEKKSLPSQGFFSPFPHGTGSLSVTREYLALRDGPRRFSRDFTCPAILRNLSRASHLSSTGLSPSLADRSRSFD